MRLETMSITADIKWNLLASPGDGELALALGEQRFDLGPDCPQIRGRARMRTQDRSLLPNLIVPFVRGPHRRVELLDTSACDDVNGVQVCQERCIQGTCQPLQKA